MTTPSLVGLLKELVELESPTGSPGTGAVALRVAEELEQLGGRADLLAGNHLRAELPGSGEPLLLTGHVDTVWPQGTLEEMPFRVEGDYAFGPGVYDMKASLVELVEAIRLAGTERRALRVVLTADEEQGSATGRVPLEEAARGVAAAFVVEPPTPDGNLKTARKGLGSFTLTVSGRAAHAGTSREEGVSAIEELAHQIRALHALNDEEGGLSVNVGVVEGGTAENVVPALAQARIDVRIVHDADRVRFERAVKALRTVDPDAELRIEGGWTRPPLERSEGTARLFAQARAHGRRLGLDLAEKASGGGSDGNLIAALGVPVLDGLGVEGGGAHSADEHVDLRSLPVRAELLAQLLQDPGLP